MLRAGGRLINWVSKFWISAMDSPGQVGHWLSNAPDGLLRLDVFASKPLSYKDRIRAFSN